MSLRLTEEEYAELMARRGKTSSVSAGATAIKGKAHKYGNQRTEINGKWFDSKHEAEVYLTLVYRLQAGEITLLLRQVSFDLPGNIRYVADFVTVDREGRFEVLDAKSEATRKNRTYINKRKQMLSEWGIEVKEV